MQRDSKGEKGGALAGILRHRFVKKRAWRHHLDRNYDRKEWGMRRGLAVILAAEAGSIMVTSAKSMDIRLIRREEQYQAEWILPWESIGPGGDAEDPGTVYGVRIRPETLEIQFYSRRHSIKNH